MLLRLRWLYQHCGWLGTIITPNCFRTQRIGVCLNPSLALINHSCDPNYGRVWIHGTNKVLAICTRVVSAGEEICDSYSGVFGVSNIDARKT